LFAFGHACFRAPQIDDDIRALGALHDAIHQLADAAIVFVIDGVALSLAHLLHNHLFGSLRRDAAEHIGRLRDHNLAAHFRVGVDPFRLGQREFLLRVGDFLDHWAHGEHVDLSRVRI